MTSLSSLKLGFTGTSGLTTKEQLDKLRRLLFSLRPTEFHHGDCVGADRDAHFLALSHFVLEFGPNVKTVPIHIHPPIKNDKRAFCDLQAYERGLPLAERLYERAEYLERDRNIVSMTDLLIGLPKEAEEQQRGGSWYTIRQARKMGRRLIVVGPDGRIIETTEKTLRI